MMDTVDLAWERIERWYAHHAPPEYLPLPPGAALQNITDVETIMQISLPAEVKTAYLRHDGGVVMPLFSCMTMLSLHEMLSTWQMLVEVAESGTWGDLQPYYFRDEIIALGEHPGPIQPVHWQRQWIPCGEDWGGNLCCIDLAPAPGGTLGQVIDWDHECGPSGILAPSILELLIRVAHALEDGPPTE